MRRAAFVAAAVFIVCAHAAPSAQVVAPPGPPAASPADDGRAQLPGLLDGAFVSLGVGHINYPFSELQLEPGHTADSVDVPHVAARAFLFGRQFGKYLSAQASYMRPIKYVRYRNVDGAGSTRFVWMHFGTVTAGPLLPIGRRFSLRGETGIAIVNRSGFEDGADIIVRNAHFTSALVGGGVDYHASPALDLVAGATYIAGRESHRQPHTTFVSAGIRYNLRPLPPERVAETRNAGFIFPERLLQFGVATNGFGYGVNNFVSKKVPIFWGGRVHVRSSAVSLQYQHNVFHTKKRFAFDIGASVAQWTSDRRRETFRTLSVYPLLRFMVIRRRPADLYFAYSVAGPSYISRDVIDGLDTGGRFTFQDFMAVGMFLGASKHVNAEVGINHYSNGNILTENAGVKIPLTFKVGYAF